MSQLTDNLNTIASIKEEIRDAIETKGVDMTGVSFASFPDKIGEIQGGGQAVTTSLSVSSNGTYTPPSGVDGFDLVTVSVSSSMKPEESLVETITTNGTYSYSPSAGSVFDSVTVTVSVPSSVSLSTRSISTSSLPPFNNVYISAPAGIAYDVIHLYNDYTPYVLVYETTDVLSLSNWNPENKVFYNTYEGLGLAYSMDYWNYIPDNMFYGRTTLKKVYFGLDDGDSGIGYDAFYGCSNLEEIYFNNFTPPVLNSDPFVGTPSTMQIKVPEDSLYQYQSAPIWSNYASQIVPIANTQPGPGPII